MAAISLSSSTIPSLNSKESFSVSAFASRSISAVKFQFPVRRVRTGDLKFPSLSSTTRCTPRLVISFLCLSIFFQCSYFVQYSNSSLKLSCDSRADDCLCIVYFLIVVPSWFSLGFEIGLKWVPLSTSRFRLKLIDKPLLLLLQIEAKKQTFDSFEDLLVNSDKPVLVDYYATWWVCFGVKWYNMC